MRSWTSTSTYEPTRWRTDQLRGTARLHHVSCLGCPRSLRQHERRGDDRDTGNGCHLEQQGAGFLVQDPVAHLVDDRPWRGEGPRPFPARQSMSSRARRAASPARSPSRAVSRRPGRRSYARSFCDSTRQGGHHDRHVARYPAEDAAPSDPPLRGDRHEGPPDSGLRGTRLGKASPAMAGPSCGCATRTAMRSKSRMTAASQHGSRSRTGTCRCSRPCITVAWSGSTERRVPSRSSMRSTAAAMISALRSTSVPTFGPS